MIFSDMKKTKVSVKRHILKTITWRVVGTIDTMILGWLVSGDPMVGITIGSFEVVTKMVLYFLHERAWYHYDFGVKRNTKTD
jgi:uncharacterized membrane protein